MLYAEECSEEEPPESYERKLDTVETGRKNQPDDTENFFAKTEEEQDIQSDSKWETKSKLEIFVTKINGFRTLTIFTKSSIIDFMVVLHMSLSI